MHFLVIILLLNWLRGERFFKAIYTLDDAIVIEHDDNFDNLSLI